MSYREAGPEELGNLGTADLLVAAGVKYVGPVIPVQAVFAYWWHVEVFGDAAVGDFKLTVEVMKDDQTTVIKAKDVATGISSIGGGIGVKVDHDVLWGGGVDALVDSPTGVIGTVVNILKIIGFIRLTLEVTTLGTGTAGQCNAVSQFIMQLTPGRTPQS